VLPVITLLVIVTDPRAFTPDAPPPVIVKPSMEDSALASATVADCSVNGRVGSQIPSPSIVVTVLFCCVVQASATIRIGLPAASTHSL
jgi:hypothetical protein